MLANRTSPSRQVSVFESPLYERSYDAHSICVLFRYIIHGPGIHFLRFYQQMDLANHTRRLIWAANESNNTEGIWKYGRVTLPSITKYRVSKQSYENDIITDAFFNSKFFVEFTMEVNYRIAMGARLIRNISSIFSLA